MLPASHTCPLTAVRQLLSPVLHTTQRKHALSDLGGVCMPPYICKPLYVWMPPICLDTPHIFVCLHMFGCSLTYTTQRKHALSDLGGVCMPPYICKPLYVWMPPICLDTPHIFVCLHMFGCSLTYTTQRKHALSDLGGVCMPPYICKPLYVWMPPICLDTPHIFVCLHMFGCSLTYTTQRKHALSDLGGVCMPPYICKPLYVWMPPICLDTPHIFVCLHMFGCSLTYTTQRSMLCQIKGVSVCPFTFVCPACLDAPYV